MSGSPILMHREKSGYTRDFNTADVYIFNVIGFALGLAISINPPFIGAFSPTANIGAVIGLGALLALANGLTYGWFAGIMPATGGDYVFVSRTLGSLFGFAASWGFTICQIYGLSLNLNFIVTAAVAPTIQYYGLHYGSPLALSIASAISTPATSLIASLFLLALYFALFVASVGIKRWVIYPLFAAALAGPLIMAYTVTHATHQDFVQALNQLLSHSTGRLDSYGYALSAAQRAGMASHTSWWAGTLRALPLGFLCFLGFTYSVYVGGEVRRADRSQMVGILGALLTGTAFFYYIMDRYVGLVGQTFNAAMGNSAIVSALGLQGGSINIFIAMVEHNTTLSLLMLCANVLWFLLVPYVIFQVCAHNLVAWACDKMAPRQFLWRVPATSSPWMAGLAVAVVAALFLALNWWIGQSLVGAVALAAVAFLLTGVAAFLLPTLRPELVEHLPPAARAEVFGAKVFQWVGGISAAGFLWILYAAIKYPEVSGGTTLRSLAIVVAVYVCGLVWYQMFHSRSRRAARLSSVDLESLLREVPTD